MQIQVNASGMHASTRRLLPFVLSSLLLHTVILFVIHLPKNNIKSLHTRPMTVYFSAPEKTKIIKNAIKVHPKKPAYPVRILRAKSSTTARLAVMHDATLLPSVPRVFNLQQVMESAKSIVRDQAIKTEQQLADARKRRLNTPVGRLAKALRQTKKEIVLAIRYPALT